ncbi:outer membrane beta-barrel protein [bacterium]|nr:outer membrane beta-barrel protein [bacterium]
MKPIYMVCAALLAGTTLAGAAQASEGAFPKWYVGLATGYTSQMDADYGTNSEVSFDGGYNFSASLGYRPVSAPFLRLEAEVFHNKNDNDKFTVGGVGTNLNGDFATSAIMANLMFDFHNSSRFTPYLGFGGGAATVKLDSGTGNDDDNVWAYQFKAGVAYSPVTMPNLDLTLGYRLLGTTDATINGVDLEGIMSHSAEVGARFNF